MTLADARSGSRDGHTGQMGATMTNSQGLVAPKTLLYSSDRIQQVVSALALQISNSYFNKDLLIICVLKGAFMFTSDLIRVLIRGKNSIELDFLTCRSYERTDSKGVPKLFVAPRTNLKGKNVLVVEDICDTGNSLTIIHQYIKTFEPKDLKTCVLLDKPSKKVVDVQLDWIGFIIPDKFVVGYGMDYNEKFRNLSEIYSID